jgi:hypothetical protein
MKLLPGAYKRANAAERRESRSGAVAPSGRCTQGPPRPVERRGHKFMPGNNQVVEKRQSVAINPLRITSARRSERNALPKSVFLFFRSVLGHKSELNTRPKMIN